MTVMRGWPAVPAVLAVVAVGTVGVLALDPGFLAWLMPDWFSGPSARGRVLQVFGVLLLLIPVTAALVSGLRGSNRAVGWYVVLAVLACLPAAAFLNRGAFYLRQAEPSRETACVERSGGPATCPGG